MKKAILPLILTVFTWGCTVGPNYRRPNIDVPTGYRGAPPQEPAQPADSSQQPPSSEQSFGDQKWFEVFQDPQLQYLIRTALTQNYDIQIAAARILKRAGPRPGRYVQPFRLPTSDRVRAYRSTGHRSGPK